MVNDTAVAKPPASAISPEIIMDSPPILITGMHRSGTSMVARFLQELGVHIGDTLLGPDRGNIHGYFEDVHFVDLERRMVAAACHPDEPGWRDCGWTVSETFDAGALQAFDARALPLLETHRRQGPWGWKDPRSTLLLDYWWRLCGSIRCVLLYRSPLEVEMSLLRVWPALFRANRDFALRIWAYYNTRLLSFLRRHRDRCVLVDAAAVCDDPIGFVGLLRSKLALRLPADGPGDPATRDRSIRAAAARAVDRALLARRGRVPAAGSLPNHVLRILDGLETEADLRDLDPSCRGALSGAAVGHAAASATPWLNRHRLAIVPDYLLFLLSRLRRSRDSLILRLSGIGALRPARAVLRRARRRNGDVR